MSFEWPQALWLLLAVPGLVALYLWLQRRRKKSALRFGSLAVVREAMVASPGWRRHVPPVLLLLAITALIVAAARPGARVTLPSDHRTIVLAIDVSLSMRASSSAATPALVTRYSPKRGIGSLFLQSSSSCSVR